MLSRTIKMTLAATLLFSGSTSLLAQDDEMKAEKQKNAVYLQMVLVDYKAGRSGEAYGIIEDHFAPAGETSGVDGPWVMHLQSGEWDAAFFWDFEGGFADMEWSTSPNDIKWMAALAEQEGSMDAAKAVIKKYQDCIARTNSTIGHHHMTDEEAAAEAAKKSD